MVEVVEHGAYELLRNKFERVCLDYVILLSDGGYEGIESHKKAVIEAFQILNQRFADIDYHIDFNANQMTAQKVNFDEFLKQPSEQYCDGEPKRNRHYSVTMPTPYWYAFLEPPHGTPYRCSDFISFNSFLFPNKESLEVYRWNDDFSNYFDEGKEWWGTGLWTVYDRKANTFVVIGASTTD